MSTRIPDLTASALDEALFGSPSAQPAPIETSALIVAMLESGDGISDLVFSPARPPQVEQHGSLTPVAIPNLPVLRAEDTARVARDLIGGNEHALRTLKEQGACDLSYAIAGRARFRVN